MRSLSSIRFPVLVATCSAAASAGAALPVLLIGGDGAGAAGLLFGGIWIGCLAWLLHQPPAPTDAASASTSPPSEAVGARRKTARGGLRTGRSKTVAAVLLVALVAQMAAFHYSTLLDG